MTQTDTRRTPSRSNDRARGGDMLLGGWNAVEMKGKHKKKRLQRKIPRLRAQVVGRRNRVPFGLVALVN